MSFWTGLTSITGHTPGAFKGMQFSDWWDENKWEKAPKAIQGRFLEETGEKEMTNWYMGRRHSAHGGPIQGNNEVNMESMLQPQQSWREKAGLDAITNPVPSVPQVNALDSIPRAHAQDIRNPYERPVSLLNLPSSGRQRVMSLYDPYIFKLRTDQMGAEQDDPLSRAMRRSKQAQQGMSTAGQYRRGVQNALGTLGDAFLPPETMDAGRDLWKKWKDFYY